MHFIIDEFDWIIFQPIFNRPPTEIPMSLLILVLILISHSSLSQIDFHRTGYHYLPPSKWMNDPNGLIYYKGKYHLFYQYNPEEAQWGTIVWGHASSKDLVFWEHEPIALRPTPGTPDADGIWSGCAVEDESSVRLFYTGVVGKNQSFTQVQCAAKSLDDNLLSFEKLGVVISDASHLNTSLVGFRDPFIWKEGEDWYMILGTGFYNVGGNALLYHSRNLENWEYRGKLVSEEESAAFRNITGIMWECPVILFFKEKAVLFLSVDHSNPPYQQLYAIGTYNSTTHKFSIEKIRNLDYGYLYAANVYTLQNGYIMIGWIREARSSKKQLKADWSGVQSIPRNVTVSEDGWLLIRPIDELQKLRKTHWSFSNITISTKTIVLEPRSATLEIKAEIDMSNVNVNRFGFALLASKTERTLLIVNVKENTILIDRESSSDDTEEVETTPHEIPIPPTTNGYLSLHVFIDHSVIEVFVNQKATICTRVYPTLRESIGVEVFAKGGSLIIQELDIWDLNEVFYDQEARWVGIVMAGVSLLVLVGFLICSLPCWKKFSRSNKYNAL